MSDHGRRAVAAGFSRDIAAIAPTLADNGYALVGRTDDGETALAMLRDAQPDLVVCDAVLPGLDGTGFVRRARQLRLNVHPGILLLKPPGLRLPEADRLASLRALVLETPLDGDALADALARLDAMPLPLPPEKAARLKALLDALGLPDHPGRRCLESAVALAWADRRTLRAMRERLYPEAARQAGLTPAQAERAIRHAIDAAWRTGEIEQQHRIFGDTIDARRGKPTSGEMIAQLADILRWEG